jgi:hypothetical protein
MSDPTEPARRALVGAINKQPFTRERLEEVYGKDNVFSTDELTKHFEVQGFAAPFVIVHRKSDGAIGTLTFQHEPRFYWDFQEDKE